MQNMACLHAPGSCAGGTVDVESVTEASLRVVTCSGNLKLGKIKASLVDVDTAGEPNLCIHDQQVLCAHWFQMHLTFECVSLLVLP